MISQADQALVEEAAQLIAELPENENHTVSAAVRDKNGKVFTGVNLYHFTGGLCAEPVALAVAAANVSAPLEVYSGRRKSWTRGLGPLRTLPTNSVRLFSRNSGVSSLQRHCEAGCHSRVATLCL